MNGASLPTARGRKTILWIVLSMPLLWLAALVIQELRQPNSGLGPEPTEALLHYLGEWSLILVLLALLLLLPRPQPPNQLLQKL